jgi:hypothetical protein
MTHGNEPNLNEPSRPPLLAAPRTRTGLEAIVALVAFATASVLLARLGYYALFSRFSFFDDEGYVLISLRHFVEGRALYDEVYSQYGPFFYLFHQPIYHLLHVPLNHDTARFMTLALWIICSCLGGLFVWFMTRRLLAVLLTQMGIFFSLFALANEPGHPIGLCLVLVFLLPVLAGAAASVRLTISLGIGILVACLLMTKINVGIYTFLALALTMAAATPGWTARTVQTLAGACILLLPALVMMAHLRESSVRAYVLLVTLSSIPVVLLHWSGPRVGYLRLRDSSGAILAALVTASAIGVGAMLQGTSPAGLLEGAVLQNRRFSAAFYVNTPTTNGGAVAAGAGVVCYLLCWFLGGHTRQQKACNWGITSAKAVFGLFVFCVTSQVTLDAPVGVEHTRLFNFALPFVWLVAIGPAGTVLDSGQQFARRSLASLAVLQSLVAYPIAGSQQAPATVLLTLVAALCLHDALEECPWSRIHPGLSFLQVPSKSTMWSIEAGVSKPIGAPLGVPVSLFALPGLSFKRAFLFVVLAAILMTYEWQLTYQQKLIYQERFALGLPGCERLHLPEGQVAAYRWLSYNLRAYADTFATAPGLNSLYFWTGIEPPTSMNATAWMSLLDGHAQQRIVDALSNYSHACAVRSPTILQFWARPHRADASFPLLDYIDEKFQTVGSVYAFQFLVRKDRRKPELLYCVSALPPPSGHAFQPPNWTALMVLPAMEGVKVHRITIADQLTGRLLADTGLGSNRNKIETFMDATGHLDAQVDLATHPIALSEPAHIWLRVSLTHFRQMYHPVFRLLDANGDWLASVPLLAAQPY